MSVPLHTFFCTYHIDKCAIPADSKEQARDKAYIFFKKKYKVLDAKDISIAKVEPNSSSQVRPELN